MSNNMKALEQAMEEVGQLTAADNDLYEYNIARLIAQANMSHQDAIEETNQMVDSAKSERALKLVELHKARLIEAWKLVLADTGKYYDAEMRGIAKYMLDIVLGGNPLQLYKPEVWEKQYLLVTRQVDTTNPNFGNKPMWTMTGGRPTEVPMRPLFHNPKKGGTHASGFHIQMRGNRAIMSANMDSGMFNINTPIGWMLAKTSMTFPVEWLYPTAINGLMRGMKWHRISSNTYDSAKFGQHITDKSLSKPGNPAKSVDILSAGMFLYKLWIVITNKDLFKGFMDSRAGGSFTCMDVAYRYGKNTYDKMANGERCSITILPRDVLNVEESIKAHDARVERGAAQGSFKLFHAFPQKPELTLEGAWQADGSNNIYIMRDDATGVWWTNQQKNGSPSVNKVCARNDKLIIGGRKVAPIGKMKILVLKDVPEELKPVFVLGNFLLCADQVRRIGIARCLTECGNIKGVGMPWNLKSIGYQIVAAKSSWKSDGSGVLAMHKDGTSKEDQLKAAIQYFKDANIIDIKKAIEETPDGDIFDVKQALIDNEAKRIAAAKATQQDFAERLAKLPTVKVKLPGVKDVLNTIEVEGWEVEDEVFASNLYATYGMRQIGEIANDGTDDEQEQNGFFTEALLGLIADKDNYSPVQAKMDGLKAKKYTMKKAVTQIKATDFMCVAKSYGHDVAKQLIDTAVGKYTMSKGSSKRKVVQDIMLNGYGTHLPEVDMDVFNRICPIIFVGQRGEPLQPSGANFNQIDRCDLDNKRWALLVDGDKGLGWPGLRNSHGMIIKQGNLSFYVPPWSVFDKDLDEDTVEDVTGDVSIVRYLGPSWTQLIVLMKAAYSPQTKYAKKTNWILSHANYTARMNTLILKDVMSKIDVKGRYYTILPKWWNDVDNEIVCTDPMWHIKDKEIKQVLYMKNPALFNKPVVNMRMSKWLPEGWLTTDKAMMVALSSAMFVGTEFMLSHQDDCDGDQAVVMDLGGILPVWHGAVASHDAWCAAYIADEKELAIGIKGYVPINMCDMHNGIIKSAEGKRDTGIMTQNFFNVMLLAERYMAKNPGADYETVRLVIESYATGVQDEAIRQIKQESGDASFFKDAALYAHPNLPIYSETRTRYVDGQPEEYLQIGSANIAAGAIEQRIKNCFKIVNIDANLVLDVCAHMISAQANSRHFRNARIGKKVDAYKMLFNLGLDDVMANRIGCLISGRYWSNIEESCPQFEALNNAKAAEAWATIIAFDIPTGDKKKDAYNRKQKFAYISEHPNLAEMAYKYHWAAEFCSNDEVNTAWYRYNTWITPDGTEVMQWSDTIFGYMLAQLKSSFLVIPPKRPVGKKVEVVISQAELDADAAHEAYLASMSAVSGNLEANTALVQKLGQYYICDVFVDPTEVVVQGAADANGDAEVAVFTNATLDSSTTKEVRFLMQEAVNSMGLVLRPKAAEVVVPPAVEAAPVIEVAKPVVEDAPEYPHVFKTKDSTLLDIGSYVGYANQLYMVYGFTKTGRAKLVALMTDESLKIKTPAVEVDKLLLKANFPMVDGLMIVKPTLAIDGKGKFVKPTDAQLTAAYLICKS